MSLHPLEVVPDRELQVQLFRWGRLEEVVDRELSVLAAADVAAPRRILRDDHGAPA